MPKVRKEYENQNGTLTLKGSMPVFDSNNDINLLNNLNIPGNIVKQDGDNLYAQDIQDRSGTIALTDQTIFDVFDLSYVAGSSASTNYKTVRWYGSYNISEPYDGMKILVRIPGAGLGTVGAMLNLSENTDAGYHPVAYNVNTVFTTHYPVGTYKLFVYDASASMTVYKTAKVAESVTGVWKGEADYNSDNDYRVRTYLLTSTNGNRDLLLRYSTAAVSTTVGGYTQQMAATGNSLYANPSTGALGAVTFIENGTPLSQLYAPIGGGGGNAEWGSISGTLSNQTDLMSKFSEYATVSALSSYATQSYVNSSISALNYASVGAASTAHTHTYSDVGAASAAHTHTYSDVGALSAATFIPSTYTDVGAMSAGKTFTYTDVGALSAGTHIPSDPVNADWSATTGLSSIKNKPTLGTAASMASTAFLSSATIIPSTYTDVGAASTAHTHTYSDVGALSAATHIPSDPVNADWSATTGLSSILNKPTLGTAASMASTAFRSASWMPTYTDVGALSAGTHIPSDPVNADWSATTGLSSILNKPTLGTAASMASTAFRPASWMPTYSDVGALSSATVIPSTYSDVGAASAVHEHFTYVERTGDTMTGQLIAQNNVAYTTAQVRNIILSTSEPTSSEGANGDIWIVYKE